MSRLLSLYPTAWRARYGAEFLALLEDRPPSPSDRVDLVRGALDARLHPELVGPAEPVPADEATTRSRRAGLVALAGAGVWLLGLVVAVNGPIVHDEWGTYRDGGAALPLLILAVAFLTIGIAATAGRLPTSSRFGRAAAWAAAAGGLLWAMAPWILVTGAVGALGLVWLTFLAIRARVWPAWTAGAVLAALAVPAVGLIRVAVGDLDRSLDGWAHAFTALALLWLAVSVPLVTGRSAPLHAAS